MKLSIILLLALAQAPSDTQDNLVTAELRSEATTPGTRIRLLDLLAMADQERLSEELLQTDLGRAPSPDFERLLTREMILANLPQGSLQLEGPDEIKVRSETVQIPTDEILDRARQFLSGRSPDSTTSRVELLRAPFSPRVPRGRQNVELKPRFRGKSVQRGAVTILTDILVDGKLQMVVPTSFQIRTFSRIPVLAYALNAGDTLVAEAIRMVDSETTGRAPGAIPKLGSLLGQTARRGLVAGKPLLARDFRPSVLIRRNDPVSLIYIRGSLRAETFGLARDSGTLGQTIKIENLTTRKILVGRVIGPGQIQMNP